MASPKWGYWDAGGFITPGGPSVWHALDWDQRRVVAVTMDEEQDSEDLAFAHLKKHMDSLASDVYAIHVSQSGDLISASTDPEDDENVWVYYPPLEALRGVLPDHIKLKVVIRSDLLEVERVGPKLDIVSYISDADGPVSKGFFKYNLVQQYIHNLWHEINLLLRLPPHPHILTFDRVVVDEFEGRVVGFTSVFVPGGTIWANTSRTFKLAHLRQLISVIDDLNLKHGVSHQDVSPRNLLMDPATDVLLLFGFHFGGQVGGKPREYYKCFDDVRGVIFTLYELITRDEHFREWRGPGAQQDIADVQDLKEWVRHPDVTLDHSVEEYRSVLNKWVEQRRRGKQIMVYTEASECIDWPDLPEPPPKPMRMTDSSGNPVVQYWSTLTGRQRDLRKEGKAVLKWQRPAENTLREGDRVLATGQLLST